MADSTVSTGLRRTFAFPNPVNEYAARSTAGIIVVLSLATLVLGLTAGWGWLLWIIALGFWLRVAGGPKYSPAGRLAVHVIAPRFGKARLVAGPPKRFAQTIGATMSTTAAVLWTFGLAPAAWALLGLLIVAASLEAFAGFCLGCWIFGRLQDAGVIPESVCEACSNISLRRA
ncbi:MULTISPECIES: DUF4395 domain-containing protein [Arthrobacter]|uniref:DUF4395 domain-containing protein n=2 Tax=Arthrobacter TaxID=1663 RepID=A0ABU9KLK0_9MICC|nr:DUF4395 domain-containing protein [Arthrobacter sp. YJM1]MDP5227781.1 DUF4395 domain-containing protein [Arthrobacter sp. YJM1]